MKGKLAISKSGHDKGSLYVILKEETANLYLADGRLKTVEKPKKKNKKHVQLIQRLPEEITQLMPQDGEFRNEDIKRIIKLYQKRQEVKNVKGRCD